MFAFCLSIDVTESYKVKLTPCLKERDCAVPLFRAHLAMFDLGMPPHGGFAIGLERLTAQVLRLANIRQATLYPRDRSRLTPQTVA
jgi:nondiscriminating aspartyl-tRNA synthetase